MTYLSKDIFPFYFTVPSKLCEWACVFVCVCKYLGKCEVGFWNCTYQKAATVKELQCFSNNFTLLSRKLKIGMGK